MSAREVFRYLGQGALVGAIAILSFVVVWCVIDMARGIGA